MKTAVSIPDDVFHDAERLAARLGLNRSELYTRALECFVAEADGDDITGRLDRSYARAQPSHDAGRRAGAALIDAGLWEW
jgi:hypothetical protein